MAILKSYYYLQIVCDNVEDIGPKHKYAATFVGTSLANTKKQARKAGFKVRSDGTVLCPAHARIELKRRKEVRKKRKQKNEQLQ